MADPTPYDPDYSFSDYQASNPTRPLPGPRVDDELANIATTTTETINALKDVRRSDGALVNGIVTPDTLSDDTRSLLTRLGDVSLATEDQAEAGTDNETFMSPLRARQALDDKMGYLVFPQSADFGAAADGSTDDTAALQAANDYAYANGLTLVLRGSYRTTATINITCATVLSLDAAITKDVSDSEAVRFVGGVGGADADFTSIIGKLTAGQSSKPSAGQTSAHAFVFEDVIHAEFGHLSTGHCAYGFYNDNTSAFGHFWGNRIGQLTCRGCVQGYLSLPINAWGGHTENFVGVAYFNGKELSDPAMLPKENFPVFVDNAEGLVFGTLNMEWTRCVSGTRPFFRVYNDSTLIINALHFEGNEKTAAGDAGIFEIANGGGNSTNVSVRNLHLNNNVQSAGTLSLVLAGTSAVGTCSVDNFSGTVASNTWTDFRLNDTDGPFTVALGPSSNWANYFTANRKGVVPSGFAPNIWYGGTPDETGNAISNPGASIDVGKASFVRLTGAASASLATIVMSARNGERTRVLTLVNNTSGAVTITGSGNIKRPYGSSFDLTLAASRSALIVLNLTNNIADVMGLSV